MKLQRGDTLLFIGDSITDAGRARPVGEGPGLGGGYPSQVAALLGATYPELGIKVLNTGISGNTVRHLAERWKTDVLDLKPNWLSIMIGTNDVWRQFDGRGTPVLPEEYTATLRELIVRAKPILRGVTVMTPFHIQPDRNDPMRRRMDEYGRLAGAVARANGCQFFDTQAAYDRAMKVTDPLGLAGDRIHPSPSGHMVLARGFLGTIGYSWGKP
ncbi:MAG: SGNH/GDSL hydrolase family protein [Armatimonadota bacterium]